ncbi:MAG: DUF2905 domain-containing protein [Aquificaceae bacterium]|nr:DUF2905 domain-containing protein [Aquificaceae bacterium]MDW8237382.1 DUF2905 domain-containing protein [Aquificaceae bacterium]
MSKILIISGILLILAGILISISEKWKLPGDFVIERNNMTIYIPIATSLILSIVLTILLNLIFKR